MEEKRWRGCDIRRRRGWGIVDRRAHEANGEGKEATAGRESTKPGSLYTIKRTTHQNYGSPCTAQKYLNTILTLVQAPDVLQFQQLLQPAA